MPAFATVEIKILSGFLLAVSLLLFGGSYTYRTSVELADSVEWVAHTQEVRAVLANLYASLAGAELAQRDYLLTGQQVRSDEYMRLAKAVQDHLAELGRLTGDNPAQQHHWAALKSAVQGRLDDMARAAAAYQRDGLAAARAVLGQGGLGSGTEDVRVITERMDAVEAQLLMARQAAAADVRRTTLISLLVTLALASAIFIVLFRGIHREMRARRDAERALRGNLAEVRHAEHSIRELNAALLAKAAQLEATNKELESFSYSVSHDLRAPLRAIDGFALMLVEDYEQRLDTEGLRYLSVIRQNSRRMGALIDDLLTFSRLGRQPVAHVEVNVDSLVREVVEEVLHTESLGQRGEAATPLCIEVEPLPAALGDRGLLRQVWVNLIANAVKYSSKAARPFIRVSGHRVGAEIQYSVRDNGVGFDMEYAGQLFRVFQRLHRADEFSGTGVGLAIVHRVVTRHGGRVWAEGKVDHGAVFSFALPRGDESG